jgi:hypothetical protein
MWPNNADLDALAEELLEDLDHRARRRIFAESRGPRTVAQAYQLQRALRRVRERRGDKVVGFKIGYTSRTVRRHTAGVMGLWGYGVMGLWESVHGYLYNDESFSNNSDVDHRRLGIEGELGVRLIDTRSNDCAEWQVAYEPIIERHAIGMDPREMIKADGDLSSSVQIVFTPGSCIALRRKLLVWQPFTRRDHDGLARWRAN